MALRTAAKKCPQGIFLRGRYRLYSRISRKLFDCLRRFSPAVDEVSVDEGYVDLGGSRYLCSVGLRSGLDDQAGGGAGDGAEPVGGPRLFAAGRQAGYGCGQARRILLADRRGGVHRQPGGRKGPRHRPADRLHPPGAGDPPGAGAEGAVFFPVETDLRVPRGAGRPGRRQELQPRDDLSRRHTATRS